MHLLALRFDTVNRAKRLETGTPDCNFQEESWQECQGKKQVHVWPLLWVQSRRLTCSQKSNLLLPEMRTMPTALWRLRNTGATLNPLGLPQWRFNILHMKHVERDWMARGEAELGKWHSYHSGNRKARMTFIYLFLLSQELIMSMNFWVC